MIEYAAMFEPAEEGGFVITFPDIGMGATQAETEEEGAQVAQDFLVSALSIVIEESKELPPAKKHRGRHYRIVRLPALADLKTELYRAFLASGVRKAELARRLQIPKGNVARLFDFSHSTRLEHIEAAFAAIGKRLAVEGSRGRLTAIARERTAALGRLPAQRPGQKENTPVWQSHGNLPSNPKINTRNDRKNRQQDLNS